MTESNPPESDAFIRSVELLHSLHRLMADGQDDSQAADDIREAMETPWLRLSAAERAKVEALSVDLYARETKSEP
jgi:hypothetical protein